MSSIGAFVQSALSEVIGFVVLATVLIVILLAIISFCFKKFKKQFYILSVIVLVGSGAIYKSSMCVYSLVKLQKELKKMDVTLQDVKSKLSSFGNV